MKRPTLRQAALPAYFAVCALAVGGAYLARPEPAHAVVTRACEDGTAPTIGGYPGDPVQVCQVGAISNPPKPAEPTPAPCISIMAGNCIAPALTRP